MDARAGGMSLMGTVSCCRGDGGARQGTLAPIPCPRRSAASSKTGLKSVA